ncbi:hypothetical protein CEXT_195231 [Caerostris extrusa]|uniref:Uncharacterized protein n=1 Tax=Caerostris extrusa TaxID=172846 RepID=A0AAV4RHJ9_CAEEX|nr:hypothetical protein CEXT_195231 [Caerostris extrusa]
MLQIWKWFRSSHSFRIRNYFSAHLGVCIETGSTNWLSFEPSPLVQKPGTLNTKHPKIFPVLFLFQPGSHQSSPISGAFPHQEGTSYSDKRNSSSSVHTRK